MADVERIEFHVLHEGHAVDWFAVTIGQVGNQKAIDDARHRAIEFANRMRKRGAKNVAVDMVKYYSNDRQTVWRSCEEKE